MPSPSTDPASIPTTTVVYTSRYGSTARYAHELATRLGTTAHDLTSAPVPPAAPLVVMAPIYASRTYRQREVTAVLAAHPGPVAVGLVGISPLDDDERRGLADRLRGADRPGGVLEVFHLSGAYDPGRLGLLHRVMMAVARLRLRSSDEPAARAIRANKAVDLVDPAALDAVVEWIRER